MKPAELLDAWRDAVRAAELAERLATVAAEALEAADQRAVDAGELAELAEQAAAAARRAADRASATAAEAAQLAGRLRGEGLPTAGRTVVSTKTAETEARDAYHQAAKVGDEVPLSG